MSGSRPSDRGSVPVLSVLGAYAVVAAAIIWMVPGLPTAVRVPLAVPLLLVAPGYAVVTALFPSTRHRPGPADDENAPAWRRQGMALSPGERAVLAVVASVAVVPMVVLVGSYFVGLAVGPLLAGVALFTLAVATVAGLRVPTADPRRPTAGEAYGAVVESVVGNARSLLATDRTTQVAVVLTAGLLVASGAVAVQGGGDDPAVTEFYLVDETGVATDGGSTETYELRVTQHGAQPQRFTVVVALYPSDAADGPPPASELVELDRAGLVVGPGKTGAETVRVRRSTLTIPGTMYFMLYPGDAPGEPTPDTAHRMLRLSVDATPG